MLKSLSLGLAIAMGIAALANGLVMLATPSGWYDSVPGVTMTGPFNQHFIRDIGLIFLLVGASFLTGVARPRLRIALWAVPTLWLSGHALFHLWEVAAGISAHSAMARDFPAVTLPALIGIALTLWAWENRPEAMAASLGGRGPAAPRDHQPG
jgi:hypothetical protein